MTSKLGIYAANKNSVTKSCIHFVNKHSVTFQLLFISRSSEFVFVIFVILVYKWFIKFFMYYTSM